MTSFFKQSFIEIQPESLVCIFSVIIIELSTQNKVCIVNKIKIFVTWSFAEKNLRNYHLENFLQINNEKKKRIIIKNIMQESINKRKNQED